MSNVEFNISILGNKNLKTISIDRIDSSKGYVRGNVQLVCWVVNQMKNDLTNDELTEWCTKVSKMAKRKKK